MTTAIENHNLKLENENLKLKLQLAGMTPEVSTLEVSTPEVSTPEATPEASTSFENMTRLQLSVALSDMTSKYGTSSTIATRTDWAAIHPKRDYRPEKTLLKDQLKALCYKVEAKKAKKAKKATTTPKKANNGPKLTTTPKKATTTPKKADPLRWIIKDSGENGDCIQGTYAGTKVSFWMPKWAAKALFGTVCVENINEKLNS